ncbi:hypothetical protein WS46_25270 [Burkholderia sp. RF4-BP95]|nr:hypothetical protein WS46_25270 [Burkholderia sp. RF4-BP95]
MRDHRRRPGRSRDAARHLLPDLCMRAERAPWLVSNFLLDGMPAEEAGVPLAWDNVVYDGAGLGYVVSTHQQIRMSPPTRSVFSAYQGVRARGPVRAVGVRGSVVPGHARRPARARPIAGARRRAAAVISSLRRRRQPL